MNELSKKSFLILVLITSSFVAFSSSGHSFYIDTIERPVIRHMKGSSYPNSINIAGKIVQATYGVCGIFCIGGTLKVELTQSLQKYRHKYIFIVAPCLEFPVKDSVVTLVATKLRYKEKECYYQAIWNDIDSGGIPFYKIDEAEANKINQAIPNESLKISQPSKQAERH